MAKVVYNACYGGFGLSRAATEKLATMGVQGAKEHLADPEAVRFYSYSARDISRHDPRLVQVVEEMGEDASGQCAALRVEDVGPGPVAYRIKEHDGNEHVETIYCDGVAVDS